MDYLIPAAFIAVAFFLGAFINNFFKSRKLVQVTNELDEMQTKLYDLQSSSKKKIGDKETVIKRLQKEKSSNQTSVIESQSLDTKDLISLNEKNTQLEKELNKIKAKYQELLVERAVEKVEKKYPMKKYDLEAEKPIVLDLAKKKESSQRATISKPKKKKIKFGIGDNANSKKKKKAKKSEHIKSKTKLVPKGKKKKSKSKKRKSKKVLALFVSGKKGKKSHKSSKKKKTKTK